MTGKVFQRWRKIIHDLNEQGQGVLVNIHLILLDKHTSGGLSLTTSSIDRHETGKDIPTAAAWKKQHGARYRQQASATCNAEAACNCTGEGTTDSPWGHAERKWWCTTETTLSICKSQGWGRKNTRDVAFLLTFSLHSVIHYECSTDEGLVIRCGICGITDSRQCSFCFGVVSVWYKAHHPTPARIFVPLSLSGRTWTSHCTQWMKWLTQTGSKS